MPLKTTLPSAAVLMLVLLLAALPISFARGQDKPPVEMLTFDQLLAAGDKLADAKDYAGALARYKDAYEKWVAEVRTLPFKQPVNPKLMTRGELKAYMAKLLEEDYTEEELHFISQTLLAFGLAPKNFDLKKTIIDMHTEEVAGFYDPRKKDMVLIKEAEQKKAGLFDFIFGSTPEFDKEEQKFTLSHEMTHALQDQHYDLRAMQEAVEDDDDMLLAMTALIEGDATVVMMVDMMRGEETAQEVLRTPPAMADAMFSLMRATMPFAAGKTIKNAPAILRESLIYPYHRGTMLVLHMTNRGGFEPVSAAFRDPPLSTEQVIHPEKYAGKKRDVPTALALPDLAPALDKRWKPLGENVMGEFQIAVMLQKQPKAAAAAAGWDGDTYSIFETDAKQTGLVWISTWDSDKEAQEFCRAYQSYLRKKLDVPEAEGEIGDKLRLTKDGAEHRVECRGPDVVAIEGFSEGETGKLIDLAFSAEKSEKKFDITRKPKKQKAEAAAP
ncbi:MAG: hypothetical protein HYS13_17010 [Planctomycetia bacterium]|nr:hypothetical protein [Planctomycetia bacterium]